MENNEVQTEQQVVAVKQEEIELLPDLGFQENDGAMVFETNEGGVVVDKETGVVASFVNDDSGVSMENQAVVSELVKSGVADLVDANSIDTESIKHEIEGGEGNTAENNEKE